MRQTKAIALVLVAGLLMGAGPAPKAGAGAPGGSTEVAQFLTPWRSIDRVMFAPDGSSVTAITDHPLDAKVAYAYIYRLDGRTPLKVDGVIPLNKHMGANPLTYSPDSSKLSITGRNAAADGAENYLVQTYDIQAGHRLGARTFSRETPYRGAFFLGDSKRMHISTAGASQNDYIMFLVQADSDTLEGGRVASNSSLNGPQAPMLFLSGDGKVMLEYNQSWPDTHDFNTRDDWIRFRDAESKKIVGRIAFPLRDEVAFPVGRWVSGKGRFPGQFRPDDMRVGDDGRSVMGITFIEAMEHALTGTTERGAFVRPAPGKSFDRETMLKAVEAQKKLAEKEDLTVDVTQLDITGAWKTIRLDHDFPHKAGTAHRAKFSADGKHVGYLLAHPKDLSVPYRLNVHELKAGKLVAAIDIPLSENDRIATFTLLANQKIRVARLLSRPKAEVKDDVKGDVKEGETPKGKQPRPRPPRTKTGVGADMEITLVVEDYDFRKLAK